MPGPITVVIIREGRSEPDVIVPMLNSYEVKTQLDALEQQAILTEKQLVVTATFTDWPEPEEVKEEKPKDGKS